MGRAHMINANLNYSVECVPQVLLPASSCGSSVSPVMDETRGPYAQHLFLLATQPRPAGVLWQFLTPGDRVALQAVHWWLREDLRWFLLGLVDSESSEEQVTIPARAG